jgi:hypothetical protein
VAASPAAERIPKAEELLRQQTRDFAAWLRQQKVL